MKKTTILIWASILAFGLSASANAGILTLDNPYQIVERPISGYVDVDFFGTLTLDQDEVVGAPSSLGAFASSGDFLFVSNPADDFPTNVAEGYGFRFSVRVNDYDALGIYNLAGNTTNAGWWGISVSLPDGSFDMLSDEFSVTVTDSTVVPEPASLALMGIGLAGLGFSRRKKAA